MKRLSLFSILLSTALFGLVNPAVAQVGQTAAPVLASPLFQDAGRSATGTLTLKNGGSVLLRERGGYLTEATVIVSSSAAPALTVTGNSGTATATGVVPGGTGSGVARAAELIGVLSGFGDGMATPLAEFLNRADVAPRLAAPEGISIGAAPFTIKASTKGKLLTLTISRAQANVASFAPTKNVLPAKKATAKPVVLRVYSDFQCPYCHQFETQTLPALLAKLPDDVRIEFHQFPLEQIHPLARASAEASECAAQQGKFWAYKDALFTDRTWLSGNPNTVFIALAGRAGLDDSKFKTCLAERGGKAAVDAGLAEAQKLGLNGTPTVFINGYQAADAYDVNGLLALMNYARAVDSTLATPVTKP